METILEISGIHFPLGSGRGVSQDLRLVNNGQMRRTINSELIDLTLSSGRKYASTISCSDQNSPVFGMVWIGSTLTLYSAVDIKQPVSGGAATLIRNPVSGSVKCYDVNGNSVAFSLAGTSLTGATGAVYVAFRPILTMKVSDKSEDFDEWSAVRTWTLSLEEV